MSKLAALMGSNGGLVAGAAIVAAAAIGAGVYVNSLGGDETAPQIVEQAALQPEPETAETGAAEPAGDIATDAPEPKPEPTAEDAPAPSPPSIDEVRVEADGLAVIAGRASPGSKVTVLLNGVANTEVMVDAAGGFAAVTMIAPNPEAQVLTLVQRIKGEAIASLDEVIVAPVAPARPEPEPQVETAETLKNDAPTVDTDATREPEPDEQATVDVAAADQAPETDAPVEDAPATPVAEAATDAPQPADEVAQDDTTAPTVDVAKVDEPATPAPTAEVAEKPEAREAVAEVAAPQAPAILKSTEDGVEVLSSTPPEALENIEIDTISYSQAGDVELAGRAQSEAEVVRVYVNNRPIADIEVDDAGRWRGELPQIDTGVYTLRVDELDQSGDVTSRVETPFKREDPETLAAADDASAPATRITVQTGNTLWGISRERYGDGRLYVQVFDANRDNIRNPDLIFPGQVFDLPE